MLQIIDSMRKAMTTAATFTRKEEMLIKKNKTLLDSFLLSLADSAGTDRKEKECVVFAEIDKSTQLLYLYLFGEFADTFKVSTGMSDEYETPELALHPEGPLLIKHTSKKFPGGNYKGMGNMPYSVFLTNGYAIHGTTAGNFKKLGSRASHGCIRLHPDNAKFFYALVKIAGLKQTWISIKDSLLVQQVSAHQATSISANGAFVISLGSFTISVSRKLKLLKAECDSTEATNGLALNASSASSFLKR